MQTVRGVNSVNLFKTQHGVCSSVSSGLALHDCVEQVPAPRSSPRPPSPAGAETLQSRPAQAGIETMKVIATHPSLAGAIGRRSLVPKEMVGPGKAEVPAWKGLPLG